MDAGLIAAVVMYVIGMVIWRLRLTGAMRGDAASTDGAAAGTVSIIVPARNEAHNLPALLASLAALEPGPLEVIVVDDHSTDGTGDIARAAGVRVVTPPPLPAGWNGKPWACHAGAAVARGAHLLFTDADTVHAPDSVGRAMATLQRDNAHMVSVVPSHLTGRLWERLQGVFHLLLLIATSAGSRRKKGERRFCIGQYLLIERTAYERAGGHGVVRARIAEDLALGRAVADSGGRIATLFSPGLLQVRMYPEGFGGFIRGWRRSFVDGLASAGAGAALEISFVIAWLLGAPLLVLTSALAGATVGVAVGVVLYLCAVIAVARRQRWLGDFPAVTALVYPVFVLVFSLVSALALVARLRGAHVVWKGRRLIVG